MVRAKIVEWQDACGGATTDMGIHMGALMRLYRFRLTTSMWSFGELLQLDFTTQSGRHEKNVIVDDLFEVLFALVLDGINVTWCNLYTVS
jgi:hypothetical protein